MIHNAQSSGLRLEDDTQNRLIDRMALCNSPAPELIAEVKKQLAHQQTKQPPPQAEVLDAGDRDRMMMNGGANRSPGGAGRGRFGKPYPSRARSGAA